ncbi:hypothetical protein E2C01_000764 [Portunus trituberculatus]|uniref:Uncharacterized protein n=1 Tax=Portunus trituberculatus TaxID=210409 RepID=A0A5B7CFI4_PORTR|nr:hypothetical protein [Portunus trituberculatus]
MGARLGCVGSCGGWLAMRQAWKSNDSGSLEFVASVSGSGKMPEHTSARVSHSSSSTSSPQPMSVEKLWLKLKVGKVSTQQMDDNRGHMWVWAPLRFGIGCGETHTAIISTVGLDVGNPDVKTAVADYEILVCLSLASCEVPVVANKQSIAFLVSQETYAHKHPAAYATLIAAKEVTGKGIDILRILPAGLRDILAQHLLTKLLSKLRHSLQNLDNGPPHPAWLAVRHVEQKLYGHRDSKAVSQEEWVKASQCLLVGKPRAARCNPGLTNNEVERTPFSRSPKPPRTSRAQSLPSPTAHTFTHFPRHKQSPDASSLAPMDIRCNLVPRFLQRTPVSPSAPLSPASRQGEALSRPPPLPLPRSK